MAGEVVAEICALDPGEAIFVLAEPLGVLVATPVTEGNLTVGV